MITIRSARQTAFRINRSSSSSLIGGIESIYFPHAESSSAPSKRYASSSTDAVERNDQPSAIAIESAVESGVNENGEVKGKERRFHRPNSRAKKQAIANARNINEAIKSERASGKVNSEPLTDPYLKTVRVEKPSLSELKIIPSLTTTTSNSSSPTLSDLLSKKPDKNPPDPWDPEYSKLYKNLINTLDSAFIRPQLRFFSSELGIYYNSKSSKIGLIKKILRSWNWLDPKPKPVERSPEPNIFDLPPPELFLLLRDNELIESMTKGYERLNLSVLPLSQAPQTPFPPSTSGDPNRMVLVASGFIAPVARLAQIIKDRKKAIQTIEFSAADINGFQAPAGLLQTVSNATGAYVEPLSDDKYRITAMSLDDAENAKRLLGMASLRTNVLPLHRPLDALLPTPRQFQAQPLRLSLYPFTRSLTEPLPWSISSITDTKALFRLKKVTEWNSKPAIREIDHKNEKLNIAPFVNLSSNFALNPMTSKNDDNVTETSQTNEEDKETDSKKEKPKIQNILDENENETKTKNQFQQLIMNLTAKKGKKRIKLIFGNLLFPIKPKDGGKLGTFDNPLPGQWPIDTIKNWLIPSDPSPSPSTINKFINRKPLFTPSLTPSMIQFPLNNGKSSEIRRIRYRSLPNTKNGETRFVQFTHTKVEKGNKWQDRLGAMLDDLEKQIGEEVSVAPTVGRETNEVTANNTEEVHSVVAGAEEDSTGKAVNEQVQQASTENSQDEPSKPFEAVFGVLKESDLFIPDRPNDARIESSTTVTLPTQKIPSSIFQLFEAEQESVSPLKAPSKLIVKEEEYQLEFDERIEILEESKKIDYLNNDVEIYKRNIRVINEGLGGKENESENEDGGRNKLNYSELECGANSNGTLPEEFYRELAFMTRDIGPDAGALKRGNILAALGATSSWDQPSTSEERTGY